MNGQPSDVGHQQLIEAARVVAVAEGLYDWDGVLVGSGHGRTFEVGVEVRVRS